MCTLIALCFAEAASRTDRSGGPYRYAVEAFGPLVGFAVGWITMVSSLLGYAAVARGFAEHAAFLVGGGESQTALIAGVVALVTLLGVVNFIGIKPSARTGDVRPIPHFHAQNLARKREGVKRIIPFYRRRTLRN